MRAVWWVIAATVAANVALADTKIGYVDLQRALNESETGKKAKAEFKVQVDKLQAKLKRQKDELDTLKDRLEKKSVVMKEADRGTLEEEYRKKLRDFERDYKDSQADLQKKDNDLTAGIIRGLQEVIHQYGDQQGYTVILETNSNAVVYGAKNADVTDAIIERYNSSHPASKKEK